jgi:predicted nucleic acid-binding protein
MRPNTAGNGVMLLDTDVMVDILRQFPPALAWFSGTVQSSAALPGLVAMELIQGCQSAAEQARTEAQLRRFRWHWPTVGDCVRAYQDFAAFHLSHGLGMIDALIGATAVGLGEPLATFNVKHYGVIAGLQTVQPY